MIGLKSTVLMVGVALAGSSFPVHAEPALNEIEEIMTPLRAGAVAREIERSCDTITRRSYRVWSEGLGLIFKAKRMGFTREEIDGFINSKAERSALEIYAQRAIESYGIDRTSQAQMCALGAQQISIGSYAGSFLQKK